MLVGTHFLRRLKYCPVKLNLPLHPFGGKPRAPDLVETRRNGFAPVSVPRHALLKSSYSCLANSSVIPKRITTEEAVVAEATRSINDPQNGSSPEDLFHRFLRKNQILFLPCFFIVAFAETNNLCFFSLFFSLEKKRNKVQDSDNSDFYIIVLILTLTHTPEEARSANVVSTEGEMFIVAVTECFLSSTIFLRWSAVESDLLYWMIPENSDTKLHKIHRFLIQLVGKYTSVHRFFPNGQQRNFKKGIIQKEFLIFGSSLILQPAHHFFLRLFILFF